MNHYYLMLASDWEGFECSYVFYGNHDWPSLSEWMIPGTWKVTD